jgi:hypothetical protein
MNALTPAAGAAEVAPAQGGCARIDVFTRLLIEKN